MEHAFHMDGQVERARCGGFLFIGLGQAQGTHTQALYAGASQVFCSSVKTLDCCRSA